MKRLTDITLQLTDEEYYNDGTMHHSTLSTYAKVGFEGLDHLFDFKESPSLLLGSLVDTYITEPERFNEKYLVADIPNISPEMARVVKNLSSQYKHIHTSLDDISDDIISQAMLSEGLYNNNWGATSRAKRLREVGTEYYRLLYISQDKTIVTSEMNTTAQNMVNALKTSEVTKFFYEPDNPFDGVERVYQPVFRETINGITYTIKPDELVVDHKNKRIIATDLKTTGKPEYKFAQSFIDWGYSQQSRLYYRIVRQALDKDEYFKDFELTNWYFIVVNRVSLTPLVWEDVDTKTTGTLYYGKNDEIVVRDPFELAEELNYYLSETPRVPLGIKLTEYNNIREALNK